MAITNPVRTNFLYQFDCGGTVQRFSSVAEVQSYNGEDYPYAEVEHTPPTFSEEPEDAEIDVTIKATSSVAALWVLGPPAYPVKVTVLDYDRDTDTATPHYRGWVVRPNFELDRGVVSFRCKSLWLFFERESFSDSLASLSRYSVFDARSGVDFNALRTGITIDDLNEERDVLTVSGITQPDDWFKGGLIIAPDRDMRTILEHKTESGDIKLYLNGGFPQFTLDVGSSADIYPGDDLAYGTWSVKFDAQTSNGANHGGWPYTPNVDPAVRGVI